ncbi:hypothetical protein FA15DRAFT_623152 [Coprinopsis marcescibilis]|uniref:Transglutaminase-like domain-containing protein n=1 Tax=Coprinopsis marcescibilis TaxID=230819 RepID=A0A5C3KNU9_COPMA|nr:hypothetical protein FA15DRAFT_623152 [Coprinopsis marcescibilis]
MATFKPPVPRRPPPRAPDELITGSQAPALVIKASKGSVPPLPARAAPALPARRSTLERNNTTVKEDDDIPASPRIDKARLISRRPPPPPRNGERDNKNPPPLPTRRNSALASVQAEASTPPGRRLPPVPTRSQSQPLPPPVKLSTKPVLEEVPVSNYDCGTSLEPISCLICHDFSAVDHHASLFPRESVRTLAQLAQDLTAPFSTETDKARSIFTWLHYNIIYDTEAFFSGNIREATPESTLRSGLAVCGGYAGLFAHLSKLAGLQAEEVNGHGKGWGYQALEPGSPIPPPKMNHAWNCVLMDGEWRLLDACWGAGAAEEMAYKADFNPYWFNASPVEFGNRHFPTDNPGYQFIPEEHGGPISWEDYISEPKRPLIFQNFYKEDLDLYTLQPAWDGIESGTTTFCVSKRCQHMSMAQEDIFVILICTGLQLELRTPMHPSESGWTATVHVPRGSDVVMYYVTTIDNQDARGAGVAEYNRAVGRKAMGIEGFAKWTARERL